ncbi:MAG: hypothetical protein H6915_09510 [Novosphingobium sp.]|nr:hypothetical protein [Novosphingobium sp.]
MAFALLLSACATGSSGEAMATWRGATLEEAIAQWGYPDAERSVAGAKQYDWVKSYQTVGTYGDAAQHTFSCTRTLTLSLGRVVDAKATGNTCPFDLSKFARH